MKKITDIKDGKLRSLLTIFYLQSYSMGKYVATDSIRYKEAEEEYSNIADELVTYLNGKKK